MGSRDRGPCSRAIRRSGGHASRQDRRRLALAGWEAGPCVIERREPPFQASRRTCVEPALLGLAGKERNAERLGFAHFRRHFRQHGDAAGNVEAADADRQPGGKERPREIDGARKLVGLHADQTDQRLAARARIISDDPLGPDPPVGLVIGVQADFNVRPKDVAGGVRPPPGRSGMRACWREWPTGTIGWDSRRHRSGSA